MNPLHLNPLNPPLAEGVGRVGFRKWYERELLSSHAHMVLAFLGVIALFAALEASRAGSMFERLLNIAMVLVSAAISYWAMRRYFWLLTRAELIANQAQCSDCGAYGRFRIVGGPRGARDTEVCCHKCDHHWVISTGEGE